MNMSSEPFRILLITDVKVASLKYQKYFFSSSSRRQEEQSHAMNIFILNIAVIFTPFCLLSSSMLGALVVLWF